MFLQNICRKHEISDMISTFCRSFLQIHKQKVLHKQKVYQEISRGYRRIKRGENQKWITFFVSEFQYTEECIPEYLKRWWRENLIVSHILTALVFLYFSLMLIIRRNLVYLFLELLPVLLLLLIRFKVSRAIKVEKERYQVNYRNTVPLMHIEIGQDILYRIEDKEKHLSLSDIKKVLETPDMIVICLRGNLILPVKKTGFIQGDAEHCIKYLRSQIGSR